MRTAARNFAATKARGEYLLFMDDDNVANSNEVRADRRSP
jgi:glycosyltransferase involved in cell wall biosynthesis